MTCSKCGAEIGPYDLAFSALVILQSVHVRPRVQQTVKPSPRFCAGCTVAEFGDAGTEAVRFAEQVRAENARAMN